MPAKPNRDIDSQGLTVILLKTRVPFLIVIFRTSRGVHQILLKSWHSIIRQMAVQDIRNYKGWKAELL